MPDDDLNHLLAQAIEEIRSLRRQNEILNAKVEVMDLFACTLNTMPATRIRGEGLDIAHALEKELYTRENPYIPPGQHPDSSA